MNHKRALTVLPDSAATGAYWLPEHYANWWLAFRRICDESDVLADAILARVVSALDRVQDHDWTLTDIGCGNGELTAALLARLRDAGYRTPAEVTLIDPLRWVVEAGERCSQVLNAGRVRVEQSDLGGHLARAGSGSGLPEVILSVHSAYYIPIPQLVDVRARSSVVGMTLVADTPESAFGKVWRAVNPALHARLMGLYRWLGSSSGAREQLTASVNWPTSAMGGNRDVRALYSMFAVLDLDEFEHAVVDSVLSLHRRPGGSIALDVEIAEVEPNGFRAGSGVDTVEIEAGLT